MDQSTPAFEVFIKSLNVSNFTLVPDNAKIRLRKPLRRRNSTDSLGKSEHRWETKRDPNSMSPPRRFQSPGKSKAMVIGGGSVSLRSMFPGGRPALLCDDEDLNFASSRRSPAAAMMDEALQILSDNELTDDEDEFHS